MKRTYLLIIVFLFQSNFSNASLESFEKVYNYNKARINNAGVDCKYGQCQARTKSTGKQCKHCVSNYGDVYCWQH